MKARLEAKVARGKRALDDMQSTIESLRRREIEEAEIRAQHACDLDAMVADGAEQVGDSRSSTRQRQDALSPDEIVAATPGQAGHVKPKLPNGPATCEPLPRPTLTCAQSRIGAHCRVLSRNAQMGQSCPIRRQRTFVSAQKAFARCQRAHTRRAWSGWACRRLRTSS